MTCVFAISFDEARALANDRIAEWNARAGAEPARELVLLDAATRPVPFGWLFSYASRSFAETGDSREILLGGGPLVVDARRGEVLQLSSSRSLDRQILMYHRFGRMVLSLDDAIGIACHHVASLSESSGVVYALLSEFTSNLRFGWVFFYRAAMPSARALDQGVAGGEVLRFVVESDSGEVFESGSLLERSLEVYALCGYVLVDGNMRMGPRGDGSAIPRSPPQELFEMPKLVPGLSEPPARALALKQADEQGFAGFVLDSMSYLPKRGAWLASFRRPASESGDPANVTAEVDVANGTVRFNAFEPPPSTMKETLTA